MENRICTRKSEIERENVAAWSCVEKFPFEGGGGLGVMSMQGRKMMEEAKDMAAFV